MTEQQLPPKSIYVKHLRRDGKLAVTYIFPLNGVKLNKIITKEKLIAESAEYRVYGMGFLS